MNWYQDENQDQDVYRMVTLIDLTRQRFFKKFQE